MALDCNSARRVRYLHKSMKPRPTAEEISTLSFSTFPMFNTPKLPDRGCATKPSPFMVKARTKLNP
jgi:hypothetical protein